MAVYERSYKRYTGSMTPELVRFTVLPRYVFKDVFKSRMLVTFFAACFIFPLFAAMAIYIRNNASFLQLFSGFPVDEFLPIDGTFFNLLMYVQMIFAFILTLFIGPGLISRDLVNNGLPLYLCRPFSRAEYVLGKFSVLAFLLSLVTWVSGWGIFLLQGNFEGWQWMVENSRFFIGMFVGSWAWIITISLLVLALSAWVRWRPLAAFMVLMVLLGGLLVDAFTEELFDVGWAQVANLLKVIHRVWGGVFGLPADPGFPLPLAWAALVAWSLLSLFLLHRKIRAYEVVG